MCSSVSLNYIKLLFYYDPYIANLSPNINSPKIDISQGYCHQSRREGKSNLTSTFFRLIHSFIGDDGGVNEKRTGRNTDPSRLVAGTGLEPVTFGL